MSLRLFQKLKHRFDRSDRVDVLLSSADPELGRYLDAVGALAATHMDDEGRVAVKLHDARGVTKGCWLEELAHALQLLSQGQIALSVDSAEHDLREVEVATCLLDRVKRGRLPEGERDHFQRALAFYGGSIG